MHVVQDMHRSAMRDRHCDNKANACLLGFRKQRRVQQRWISVQVNYSDVLGSPLIIHAGVLRMRQGCKVLQATVAARCVCCICASKPEYS